MMRTTMMTKTFENMQQLGREWSAYSRRVSRDALRAMSGQLENAARYLGNLSHRFDHSVQDEGNGEGQQAAANGHDPQVAEGESSSYRQGTPPTDTAN